MKLIAGNKVQKTEYSKKKSSVEYLDSNVKRIEIKFRYLKYDTNCCEIYTLYSKEKIRLRLIAGKKIHKKELFKKNYTIEWWDMVRSLKYTWNVPYFTTQL